MPMTIFKRPLEKKVNELSEQKVNNNEMGFIINGNKTTASSGIAIGQYVFLRNSTITGCDDGLYTALKTIPYNTVIDSTYLSAVTEGGLNSLNNKFITQDYTVTTSESGNASITPPSGYSTPISAWVISTTSRIVIVGITKFNDNWYINALGNGYEPFVMALTVRTVWMK